MTITMAALHFRHVSWLELSFSSILVLCLYYIVRTIYRLYFHPLAGFPGPNLAAIGRWYEFYYEMVQPGMFSDQRQKMHEEYGPIVRINHQEVHIDDPDFYDKLYNFNPQLDKMKYAIDNLQNTPSFTKHKLRRHALDSYFSRRSVLKLEFLIRNGLVKLCDRLREAKESTQPINVSLLYKCLACDIISEYSFGESWRFLDDLVEAQKFFVALNAAFQSLVLVRESPLVNSITMTMMNLPSWMLPADDGRTAMLKAYATFQACVRTALRGEHRPSTVKEHRTIFEEYKYNEKLPAEERTEFAIFQNAFALIPAAVETIGYTLVTAHYHLLANPESCRRLRAELNDAWPDENLDQTPHWTALEKLPYLKAVIQESLRLSIGANARLSRVNHHEPMRYKDWVIPPHTAISMSQQNIHYNATIFPEPSEFRPQRWLKGEESKQLEKYLVSFSRGSRACIGVHLAQAELYLALATVFRRFDMELFETTRRDVDPKHDFFIPCPALDSEGVRVMVK